MAPADFTRDDFRESRLSERVGVVIACLCVFVLWPASRASAATAATNNIDRVQQWYRSRALSGYHKGTHANVAWNNLVTNAFEVYARLAANPRERTAKNQRTLQQHLQAAVEAGCNDPLVRFLRLENPAEETEQSPDKVIAAYVIAADRLDKTKYSTPFKFFALLRVWNVWTAYNTPDPSHPPQYSDALRCYTKANQFAKKIVTESNTPPEVAYGVCQDIMNLFHHDPNNGLKAFYDSVKNDFARKFPESVYTSLLRADFYYYSGWHARGNAVAGKVTEEGWRLFRERFSIAEDALQKAWALDPTIEAIPVQMINVELGQGQGRERMEQWFRRAMALNPNSYDACRAKQNYLSPRWFGNGKDAIEFGRECVAATTWGGGVPWTLIDAHQEVAVLLKDDEPREAYWKRPAVWRDLKSAFEKYLVTNPEKTNATRHSYILYARSCDCWDEVEKQLKLLTSTNDTFFGGRVEFDELARTVVEKAKARSDSTPRKENFVLPTFKL
jgi:hypothetical protein